MATLVVMVGQCGNQLGDELFTQLCAIKSVSARAGAPSSFFASDGMARCVLVDTEPKVVQGVQRRHSDCIRAENVVSGQSGRGNNWGLGYYGVNNPKSQRSEQRSAAVQPAFRNMGRGQREKDDGVLSATLRAIHMETRRTSECAEFEAIFIFHSLVGGTGSGLASRLAEKIRLYFVETGEGVPAIDEKFEDRMARADGLDGMLVEKRRAKYLLSVAVAPQRGGELSTQGLNAALTLQVLHRCADAVLLLRNDDAMGTLGSGQISAIPHCGTFKETNEVFVSLLLPLFNYGEDIGRGGGSVRSTGIGSLVRQCAPCKAELTGGNNILTLVPTPQRVYERLRGCAHRCRLYAISGCKQFLPGCKPEVPVTVLLSSTAASIYEGQQHGRSESAAEGRDGGRSAPLFSRRTAARRVDVAQCPPDRKPRWHTGDEIDDGDSDHGVSEEDAVYGEVPVAAPAPLTQYYRTLRRAPVAKLYEEIEGVLVMNQARELNASVLFPLLRSAALKVKVGAFIAMYEDVGVDTHRITKAYQSVAEFLSYSEEL